MAPCDAAGAPLEKVKTWFGAAVRAGIPMPHWTMAVVRRTPNLSHAKAEDGSRAYHAKVRAWWDFCRPHRLTPLSGSPSGVAARLAAESYPAEEAGKRPKASNAVELRTAAIAYLH